MGRDPSHQNFNQNTKADSSQKYATKLLQFSKPNKTKSRTDKFSLVASVCKTEIASKCLWSRCQEISLCPHLATAASWELWFPLLWQLLNVTQFLLILLWNLKGEFNLTHTHTQIIAEKISSNIFFRISWVKGIITQI